MSPEKLAQLRRQRELIQQHLDWLDAEIADIPDRQPAPLPDNAPIAAALDPVDPVGLDIAKPDPQSASTEAKRGCLILFFGIIGLLIAMLVGIYFWKYRDRPLLFSENAADASYSRSIKV